MLPDFELIADSEVTAAFRKLGIHRFSEACAFVQNLPYGRNASRADFLLTLSEGKGTCSSKHGLLAQLAEAHGQDDIHLMVGIFLMGKETHPQTGAILGRHGLKNIPEAHCYLRYNGGRYDFTAKGKDISGIEPFIVREQRCEPNQLIDWKPMIHKHYLESWLKRQQSEMTLDEVWEIREACIQKLSLVS